MGINGYIDPVTWRHTDLLDPGAGGVLNPIFRGWATAVTEYVPSDQTWSGPGVWNNPLLALGPVTGENFDIVSLGEVDRQETQAGAPPGFITLVFGDPCNPADANGIRNGSGYDYAVYENAITSQFTTLLGSFQGQILAELAYVDVSSNGRDFARFPSVSLTGNQVGAYGTIEASNVHNLAGKHPNANSVCVGTPFDLDDLANCPQVISGAVDLNDIRYVRIVDVPGNGMSFDAAAGLADPDTWPEWQNYTANHAIYDAWPMWGSGGFDLEAVGVLHEQQYGADLNLDGRVDAADLTVLAGAWQSHSGGRQWLDRCDMARPKDGVIRGEDFAVFASQWRHTERWRAQFETE